MYFNTYQSLALLLLLLSFFFFNVFVGLFEIRKKITKVYFYGLLWMKSACQNFEKVA